MSIRKRESARNAHKAPTVFVYGYGDTKNPFIREAQKLNVNSQGCSLIIHGPIARGQKLLLMNGNEGNPVQAEIVGTRPVGAEVYEVELSFAG